MWFLGKGGGVPARGGVTRSSAQNRDWPFPEWESAGGGKAHPALQPQTTGGPGHPAGKQETGQKFRAPQALMPVLGGDRRDREAAAALLAGRGGSCLCLVSGGEGGEHGLRPQRAAQELQRQQVCGHGSCSRFLGRKSLKKGPEKATEAWQCPGGMCEP